jgi:SOS response regulatory protein OraA/RecX
MAERDHRKHRENTDGGEAVPRPHRAFRLVDEHSGTDSGAAEIKPCRIRTTDREPLSSEDVGGGYMILSVTPEGEGETVAVVLSVPNAEGGKPERVKLHLLVEQYADLGVKVGEITPEQADRLLEAGKLCAAVRRGMGLLQYGDKSARRLAYKLTAKGIDRETATAAAAYLSEKGYIREDDTARLRAEQGVRKGWGLRRICEDLRAQGFTADVIDDAAEGLSEVDFVENCVAVIRKKYGDVPEERPARQKMVAALMRLGYDSEEIREAMRMLLRKK